MSSNEIFDELIALRIGLQDIYFNEQDIIRELKVFLRNKNIRDEDMDQIILDFYKDFDINFPIEFISEVNLPSIQPPPPLLAQGNNGLRNLLMSYSLEELIEEDEDLLNESGDSDDEILNQDSDDQVNDNNEEESNNNQVTDNQVNDNISFLPFPQNLNNLTQGITISHGTSTNSFSTFSIPPDTSNQTIDTSNVDSSNVDSSNVNGNNIYDNNIFNSFGVYGSNLNTPFPVLFQGLLNNSLHQLMSPVRLNTMEDVKVTLEDSDLEGIIEKKLDNNLDQKCSVCMMDLLKDEFVSELKCKHIFHSNCIKQWLKEYSYKCPVCREECGTAKYHT